MSCVICFAEAEFNLSGEQKHTAYQELRKNFLTSNWMKDCHSLEDVLSEFGFETESDENDNIISIEDVDMDNNDNDVIESIFSVIAPFVYEGSYIELYDEYGGKWRWIFRDGKCIYVKATVTWEETEETAHECE